MLSSLIKPVIENGTLSLVNLRGEAGELLEQTKLPNYRQEAYRFNRLKVWENFEPVASLETDLETDPKDDRFYHVVLLDGRLSKSHSNLVGLPKGTVIAPFSSISSELFSVYVGELLPPKGYFNALNSRFFEDGLLIHLPENTILDKPLRLVMINSGQVVYPRILVNLQAGSHLELMIDTQSQTGSTGANVEVFEGFIAEGAVLSVVRNIQDNQTSLWHSDMAYQLLDKAQVNFYQTHTGALNNRLSLTINHQGADSRSTVRSLQRISGEQEGDLHLTINHLVPSTESDILHKTILQDKAHGIYNGCVVVAPDAQQTNSVQATHTLLLSDRAKIDAKPELYIDADDVKCAHGATVGQLDEEGLFYLLSRGINQSTAQAMLVDAFADEITFEIPTHLIF
jgi:Fe-S cluster assembly protein SufD